MKKYLPILSGLSIAAFSGLAHAEDPAVTAELLVEWQNEFRHDSEDTTIDETNNSFVRSELAPTVRVHENVYFDGVLVFEQLDQAATVNSGDDIWFDREGAFIEEIKVNFEHGPYHVFAGKFNPAFGSAWDLGRGIWSEDFAEDYEITEKLGGGAAYTLETQGAGSHTISASTFFSDTTALSQGAITQRDQLEPADGGAGNTEDFSSYAVSLNGENLAGIESLNYNLGYRFLAEQSEGQSATTDDETGFVAGLGYVIPINQDLSLDTLVEYTTIQDFGGTTGTDQDYYYASVVARIMQNWNVAAGITQRDIEAVGAADVNDQLVQFSGGYDFQNGLTAEAGVRESDEAGSNTSIVGFLLRYTKEL